MAQLSVYRNKNPQTRINIPFSTFKATCSCGVCVALP